MNLIKPNWPAPENIVAFSTTRGGGVSEQPFDSLNLAQHVNDHADSVRENRQLLAEFSNYPREAHWLNQTHSIIVVPFKKGCIGTEADGVYSNHTNQACVVMTADCLPVLLCSKQGDFVAALHAGWRGLLDGILLEALKLYVNSNDLMAWIGPAISQKHFEVGTDVKSLFLAKDASFESFFKRKSGEKYLADIAAIAESQLQNFGVQVYQSNLCTYANQQQFFSYRRDGDTGRMASMIWIKD